MRLYELFTLNEDASAGTTSSGSVATVSAPLGQIQRRISDTLFTAKYATESDPTPNTPSWMKKYKQKSKK